MPLDFTLNKYVEIITAISESGYQVITISDYISLPKLPDKFIILRHDVDIDSDYQVKFAELEHNLGLRTSYYFRYVKNVYREEAIDKVFKLAHEVGYHYEVFTKAKGNEDVARNLFREELAVFQQNWGSKTVCPHGGSFIDNIEGYALKDVIKLIPKFFSRKSVFSSWSNFDLWGKNKFTDFRIIGDAYRSIDFSDILYLSDTGRSWDRRFKRLDKVDSNINPLYDIRKSDEIIELIKKGEVNRIYLLIHLEQWKNNLIDWVSWYIAQLIRRNGKKLIFKMKQSNPPHSNK
jgi:hypothetical protein